MGTKELYDFYLKTGKVSTDTRHLPAGCVFFALRGETFNGNKFAAQALESGAGLAVVDDPEFHQEGKTTLVENSLVELQKLATFHRAQFQIPVVGITGSNGKTTTKELIAAILSLKYKVHATSGNLNNHIGVPLTLLAMPVDTEIAIIEMGANHIGEIETLCQISNPDYAIITNIGKAHLEGFGSLQGVIRAKSELFSHVRAKSGKVFIHSDDDLLTSLAAGMELISYGNSGNYVSGEITSDDTYLNFTFLSPKKEPVLVESQLVGAYNFPNMMAAVCIGRYFGVADGEIAAALSSYKPGNNRSQLEKTKRNTLILDAYNANPSSMKLAITSFLSSDMQNKMMILGDMRELGVESEAEHRAVLKMICDKGFGDALFVGPVFSGMAGQYGFRSFEKSEEAHKWLEENPVS
ncbi:MAG: UDP-N-acetylmuramoyl-tripeptide--D-alanyl-D-alanine ligase, partial [Bacteroidetes bacterium]|nr:UDP-N-acetylmuramoyl-tripeptide--D-alanyl-D-alanine ligase [Bacteroidota bacterium]